MAVPNPFKRRGSWSWKLLDVAFLARFPLIPGAPRRHPRRGPSCAARAARALRLSSAAPSPEKMARRSGVPPAHSLKRDIHENDTTDLNFLAA